MSYTFLVDSIEKMGIIQGMDRAKLEQFLNRQADRVWLRLCERHTKLVKFNPPKIKLNGRLWRTAGMCYQEKNYIDLGYKFFLANPDYYNKMVTVILPHEIIHQADYNLFGDSEKKCGHGKKWQLLMSEYGLEPNPFHDMEIQR
jgi:predicted SprT family Zn-dependent metalloprotease